VTSRICEESTNWLINQEDNGRRGNVWPKANGREAAAKGTAGCGGVQKNRNPRKRASVAKRKEDGEVQAGARGEPA